MNFEFYGCIMKQNDLPKQIAKARKKKKYYDVKVWKRKEGLIC